MSANEMTCYAWAFEGAPTSDQLDGTWIAIPGRAARAATDVLTALLRAKSSWVTIFICSGSLDATGTFRCSDAEVLYEGVAADSLLRFARHCAYVVANVWNAPDQVIAYLRTGAAALRAPAFDAAWAAANGLDDADRIAAAIAMQAARPDHHAVAAREAYRLTMQILGAASLIEAHRNRTQLERALAAQLLRELGTSAPADTCAAEAA